MKKMHLAWFNGFSPGDPGGWNASHLYAGYDWKQPELYQDMALVCERGKFDMVLFADVLAIPNQYSHSMDAYIRHAVAGVNHDPLPLIAMMAAKTRHIGLASTLSTTYYPPYLLARIMATLDHLTRGRIGWNVVTSANPVEAQNFGVEDLPMHDQRYEMADEYMELCYRLWESWEEGAEVLDAERGIYADPSKVHSVDFSGKYFRSRGPLNVVRSPQVHPVILQAGSSERGKEFAARHAEVIICNKNSIEEMKLFYEDIKLRVKKHGRDPEAVKVFFTVRPVIGDTEEMARFKEKEWRERASIEAGVAYLSGKLLVDLSQYDLDQPLQMELNHIQGIQGTLMRFYSGGRTPTLREIALQDAMGEMVPVVGTPEQVADRLQDIFSQVGGDGFAIRASFTPAYVVEFIDRVVPILQKRGLARTEYTGSTFREHLMEF